MDSPTVLKPESLKSVSMGQNQNTGSGTLSLEVSVPASGGCEDPWACGRITPILKANIYKSLLCLHVSFSVWNLPLPFSNKDSWLHLDPTWTVQDNVFISKSLPLSYLQRLLKKFLPCKVIFSFQELKCGYLWGAISQPTKGQCCEL